MLWLGAFAKLRKATISFVMSVRLSVRLKQIGSHWKDFHEYLSIVRKSVEKIQVPLLYENLSRKFRYHYCTKICRENSGTIIVRKSVEKIQVPLKSDKNDGYITWRPIHMFWSYLHQFFLECEIFRTETVEKTKHILRSMILFTKVVSFMKHSAKIL